MRLALISLFVLPLAVGCGDKATSTEDTGDAVDADGGNDDGGSEGGDDGGEIVAAGTPEELAEHSTSHTGKFLKEILSKPNFNDNVKLVKAS